MLVSIFAVLITGIFVFMAFRIDRGARWEARHVAEEVSAGAATDAKERTIYAATRCAERLRQRSPRRRPVAHEIGHHLQGHTIQRGGSRPPIELEADNQ